MKVVSINVKELRLAKNLTIRELAFLSQHSEKTIRDIEDGPDTRRKINNVTLKTIITIAKVLEIPVEDIIKKKD